MFIGFYPNDIVLSLIRGISLFFMSSMLFIGPRKGGDLNPLLANRKIDITDIKFENNYFDFIICNHVLEYIQDDKEVMSELFRVLRPEGIVILQVPISKNAKETSNLN